MSLLIHPKATPEDWQCQLQNAISSGEELLSLLGLTATEVGYSEQAAADFTLKVPLAFIKRMKTGDSGDPLLLQVLASNSELLQVPGFSADPVGETGSANPRPGIIHKYRGRVLLIVSSGCAVNCRYCFRRHFPYADNRNSRSAWRETLQSVAGDHSIREVILSGGDPLMPADPQLAELVDEIAAIPHVKRLRIHTRLPVVIPARVTAGLLQAICRPGLQTVMVVHCNHANEIDSEVIEALGVLRAGGVNLLNQSVLLAGVNDSPDALLALSESLFSAGVLPYYLHLLDRVHGAAHFDVPEQRARQMLSEISARLPGYLVPKLVREIEGAPAKVNIAFD